MLYPLLKRLFHWYNYDNTNIQITNTDSFCMDFYFENIAKKKYFLLFVTKNNNSMKILALIENTQVNHK